MAIYRCPDTTEKDWREKYKVKQGQYLCDNCNKPQNIKNFFDYLTPCKYCGCEFFGGKPYGGFIPPFY